MNMNQSYTICWIVGAIVKFVSPTWASPEAGVVHRAFGRDAAFFLCAFATGFVAPAFARARAALLAAARLSGDHGVY
jgi:hypothetical protein